MTAVIHRNMRSVPPVAVGGDGPYLIDETGKRYFDGSGGAAVSCLGHGHRRVVDAIRRQIGELAYAHTSFFTNEPAEALARHLIDRAPSGFGDGRVMYLGSGSEAMEAALKLARQYYVERGADDRSHFIARDMAYHGNTLGALAVGGHRARRKPYAPLLIDVGRVPACYPYRYRKEGESETAFGLRVADAVGEEVTRLGADRVAGFVAETVSGATLGCVPPVPGYFRRIREICDENGMLLIADEVMCGMGRTGTLFAMEQEGVCPDLITIAKGLGAGYQPIAAVLVRQNIVDAIVSGSGLLANGHTYMSHAVACAGALAVLRTIDEANLLQQVRELGDRLQTGLAERIGGHPHVGDIRGRGLFRGVEFVADRSDKRPFPQAANFANRFRAIAQDKGLICYPASGCADGVLGDHLLLAPPFIVSPQDIDMLVDLVAQVLDICVAETVGV